MGRGERRRCCRRLFRPDPRHRYHQYYCSASRARRAGSPSPRTATTSAAPCLSSARGRALRGFAQRARMSILRYKISQQRNPLVLLIKQTISRARLTRVGAIPFRMERLAVDGGFISASVIVMAFS